jgi:uncharacterized protein (DUF433 family)
VEKTDPNSPFYPYVWIDPERVSGAPCFRDTRVPVQILFDHVGQKGGLEEFLENFPPVTLEQAEKVLELSGAVMDHYLRGFAVQGWRERI